MFDVGFWEVALIIIVALIILGPERLLEVSKKLGRGYSKLKKSMERLLDE